MGKVIKFPSRSRERIDGTASKLMAIADEIDGIILKHLDAGDVDPRDLAGLIAHRLGALMRPMDQKSKLWDVCERVVRTQAAIDE